MSVAHADAAIRKAAFGWLRDQVQRYGDVLPRKLLEQGFVLNDERIRLVGPQGIIKPRALAKIQDTHKIGQNLQRVKSSNWRLPPYLSNSPPFFLN